MLVQALFLMFELCTNRKKKQDWEQATFIPKKCEFCILITESSKNAFVFEKLHILICLIQAAITKGYLMLKWSITNYSISQPSAFMHMLQPV